MIAVKRLQSLIWILLVALGALGAYLVSLKVATEQYDTTTTPETVERDATPEEIAEVWRDYVAPFFPGVTAECTKSAVCLYTCTEDTRFVVDALPGHANIIVASPCSGHGFKHSAAIGEAIAGRILGKDALSLDTFKLRG